MSIAILGPLTVDGDGSSLAPRERIVLAALAMQPGVTVSAEGLAEAMWDLPPESWRKVVQGCVVRLRKLIGSEAIETRGTGYCLKMPADDIDVRRFEHLLGRARELLMLGESARAVYVADEALGLWRGRALPDLENWGPGRIEAGRLGELRLEAEEMRIDASLQSGWYQQVLAEAQARVAEAPLREHRWVLLAMALYQAGRQSDALRTLHRARQMLAAELGLDPGPDIVALEDAILRQDPTLIAAQLPDPSPVCPYRGLRAYDIGESDSFFGRATEVSECLQLLADTGVLAVLGPSGSGKSSLVRAGVCAALQSEGQTVELISPGAHPMDVIDGLPHTQAGFVLVVDQCEQAVMLCPDPEERTRFFKALATHAERNHLVIALRADRLGEMSRYPEFAGLLERGLYLVKTMTEENLRTAIEAPARQAGLLVEPGLVDLLVREVEGEPGSLPLLSHALRETWDRREGNTLTVAGYLTSGGIRGAVAQSAEDVYEHAPLEERPLLKEVLLRLVTPSPDGEPVRSRVPRKVVAADAKHRELVEKLVEARLLTSDEDFVELAHEALARAWPRLRSWLDEDLEGQRIWRHLAIAAEGWDSMGCPESELYRGSRLIQAMEWRDRTTPDLNEMERDFLHHSQQLAAAEDRAIELRMRHQQRTNRRLRLLAWSVAVFAVVAVIVGLVARREAVRADAEAAVARSNELAASAISVMDDDPSLAKLLALTAAKEVETPSLEAMSAMHEALAADLVTARFGTTFDVGMVWADLHPAGDRFVLSGTHPYPVSGAIFEVVDVNTEDVLWSKDVGASGDAYFVSAFVGSPFFSSDGERLIAGVFWNPYNPLRIPLAFDSVDEPNPEVLGAHIWDAETGELVGRFDLGRCGGLVVGETAEYLLVKTLSGSADVMERCSWADGRMAVELVEVTTGSREVLTPGMDSRVWGAAMSGDGRRVAYDDGATKEIVVLDLASQREVMRVPGSEVRDLNNDGSLILVGDMPIEVWDVGTGEQTATFDGHHGESTFARFGPSGDTVSSTGANGILYEWAANTGNEAFAYPGLGNGRPSFTKDGLILVARPDRDTLALLDTRLRSENGAVETCHGFVPPDNLTVVDGVATFTVVCDDSLRPTTHVVDVRGESPGPVLIRQGQALGVSPDGDHYVSLEATRGRGGPLLIRDVETGEAVLSLEGPCSSENSSSDEPPGCVASSDGAFEPIVRRVRWSPDQTMIAGIVDGGITVWSAASGDILHTEPSHPTRGETVDLIFSPDSALLITTNTWLMRAISTDTWETTTTNEVNADGGYHMGFAGFSSNGSSVITVGAFQANAAGAIHWYDADTLNLTRSKINIHGGSIRSVALDPYGTRLATASSDGVVRIWDLASGDLLHEIPFSNTPIQGVAFLDDESVAITPDDGSLLIAVTDPEELVAAVQGSLTRGFTLPECDQFGFGDECPTLAELRGPEASLDVLNVIAGTYAVRWSRDDLATVMMSYAADFLGVAADPELEDAMAELARLFAGTYTATFAGGRFDISREDMEDTWCTGAYTILGDRIWLRSERGSCTEVKLFDAAFAVGEEGLRFDAEDIHGVFPFKVLFGSRPLERVDRDSK